MLGFEDVTFRTYFTRGGHADALESLSHRMADSENPVVQYAAGWAAADAALSRPHRMSTQEPHPIDRRTSNLATAGRLWETALPRLGDARLSMTDPRQSATLFGYQLRTQFALDALPLMHIAAAYRVGQPVAAAVLEGAIAFAKYKEAASGRTVLSNQQPVGPLRKTAHYFRNVLTTALLLQQDSQAPFIVLPASIRHGEGGPAVNRTDLVAVHTSDTHAQTAVRLLRGEPKGPRVGNAAVIYEEHDLSLNTTMSPVRTLRESIAMVHGAHVATPITQCLAELSGRLVQRVLDVDTELRERQQRRANK